MKAPFTEIVLSFTSEQPTEVSLCHSTTNLVTTEPGTLPVILMKVAVTIVGSSSTAADGTEREQSLISNSEGTRAHYHNKPTPTTHKHMLGMKVAWGDWFHANFGWFFDLPKATSPTSNGARSIAPDNDDVPTIDMV